MFKTLKQFPQPDITIDIYPNSQFLCIVRQFINAIAHNFGLTDEESLQIEMCVDEACANSIEHMKKKPLRAGNSCVKIGVKIDKRQLHIMIQDRGDDFTEHFQKAAPFTEISDRTRKRGYGLQIIKTFMDEVHYFHSPEQGNLLYLIKNISRKKES